MSEFEGFPESWPPENPDNIQLYSMATPNGQKIGIALEELELGYDPHLIHIGKGDQHHKDFARISPNGKIPVLIDPHGPEDEPAVLMESIAILLYLSDKTDQLMPRNYRARMEHMQWLLFQAAHIGPMFGQFGHFYVFAREKTRDTYALERYSEETRRLLGVLDERLQHREYIMGDFSIVDIATAPWVQCLRGFYQAGEHLQMAEFSHVIEWLDRVTTRPSYITGSKVCAPG